MSRLSSLRRKIRLKAMGLCTQCGVVPTGGFWRCTTCRFKCSKSGVIRCA
jgi:hypothetical protein